MRNLSFILVTLLIVITIACTHKETKHEIIIENCAAISNTKVLTEAEKNKTCNLINVYSYQNDIYLRCTCCLCNKLDTAMNCDSIPLCGIWVDLDNHNRCMEDFHEEATYLFSVEDF